MRRITLWIVPLAVFLAVADAHADTPAGHWGPAEPIDGAAPSSPPAAAWSQLLARVSLFFHGANDHLWRMTRDVASGTWAPAREITQVTLRSGPAATWSGISDVVQVFYRGTDDALWWTTWSDDYHEGTWSTPQRLPATGLTDGPAVAVHFPASADLDVYYPGPSSHLWRVRRMGASWSTPFDLGVKTTSTPAIVAADDGRRTLFFRGTDDVLYQMDGVDGADADPSHTQWSAPIARVTAITSPPAATIIPGRGYTPALATGGVAFRNHLGHLETATTTNGAFSATLDLGDLSAADAPTLVWLPPFNRTESVELYFEHAGALFRKVWEVPPPYDLVWSEEDEMGVARSPAWGWQVLHGGLQRPSQSICAGPWGVPCTTQHPKQAQLDCGWSPGHVYRDGSAGAGAAVYTGVVYWENHSASNGADDDYNLRLVSPSHAGETTSDDLGILLEFDSDETIDHFHTPSWNAIHAAVDAGNEFERIHRMIDGADVVALGNPDLDCVHSCGMELHPVWALAIHTKSDPTDDVWTMFFRNWGNKGFCGRQQYRLQTDSMTLRLPWRQDARNVSVLDDRQFLTNDQADVWGPYVAPLPGVGVDVAFHLPGPEAGGYAEGELHLQWEVGTPPPATPTPAGVPGFGGPALGVITAANAEPLGCPAEQMDPEEQIDGLIRSLGSDEATRFRSMLSEQPATSSAFASLPVSQRPPRHVPTSPSALAVRFTPDPAAVAKFERRVDALGAVLNRDLTPLLGVARPTTSSPPTASSPSLLKWAVAFMSVLSATVVALGIVLLRLRRR